MKISKEEILKHAAETIGDYGGEDQYSETQCASAMKKYAEQDAIALLNFIREYDYSHKDFPNEHYAKKFYQLFQSKTQQP